MVILRGLMGIIVFLLAIFCSSCDIGKSAEKLYDDGLLQMRNGKSKNAYKSFKNAASKEPKNHKYQWAASNLAPDQNRAFTHTKAAWDNGFKNPVSLLQLTKTSFHVSLDQKLEYALSLYNILPDSVKSVEFKGDIYYQFKQYDSSLVIWKSIEKVRPNAELCHKIAMCYEGKGNLDTLQSYLQRCKKAKLLNSAGFTMLASVQAIQYEYAQVDSTYARAVAEGFADSILKVEYASLLIFQNKIQDAKNLLLEVVQSATVSRFVKFRAVTMLTFIAGMQKDNEKLKQIITESVDSSAYSEIERDFCQLFLSSNESDTSGNLSRISSIKKKSPPNPYIDLVYARELLRTKKFLEADTAYRKLPTVMLSSPIILVEIATVQANCGKGDEALARISKMHQHNIFNKPSLELFRDLTFKKKLFEKTIAAQKLLEQRFKDDAGLQWKGALLALNQGKLDSAITLLSVLSKKYPKEPQFEITRITAILLKGDYTTALKECSTSTAPAPVLKTLQAKALRKMDKPELARTAYEEALSLTKGEKTELLLEYAEFLIELGDNKKASSVFGDLAAEYEKKPNQNPLGLAMLFNNLAWTSLQSGIYNEKTLIDAAKKAYDLQPENLSIIDTYATILLKFLKYKECITLLKDKPSVIKEPRLASHLGQAFEKSGDINRAVRAYQDAIAIPDSSMQLPLLVSKDKLTEHIKILQTAKK